MDETPYCRIIMQHAPVRFAFDVIAEFLTSDPTPEEILAYRLPDDLQARAAELVEKNGEGQLTFDEQQEMWDLVRADQMIGLVKAKTKRKMRQQGP